MVGQMNDTLAVSPPAPGCQAVDAFDEIPIAYVEVNSEGIITRANRAARAFHPDAPDGVVGRSAFEFSPADQADNDRNAFLAMMKSGQEPPVTRRALLSGAGEYRTYGCIARSSAMPAAGLRECARSPST